MAKTQRMPDLSNATAGGIVDMCAPDQLEYNRLDKLTKYYKEALKARLTEEMRIDPYTHIVKGENFSAIVSEKTRTGFSLARALELGYITQEQVEECMITGDPYRECRFNALEKTAEQLERDAQGISPAEPEKKKDTLMDSMKLALQEEGLTP